jgi:hypothetical protein
MSNSRHSYKYSNQGKQIIKDATFESYGENEDSQYSEYNQNKNNDNENANDYFTSSSYNSFKFESRVADYGNKAPTILKTEEFNSAQSYISDKGYIPPSKNTGYIPPQPKKNIQYEKDEYPSAATEEAEKYKVKNTTNSNNMDYISDNSFDDYDYETYNKEKNNNKVGVYKQEGTVTFTTEYDNNSNYYEYECDPK